MQIIFLSELDSSRLSSLRVDLSTSIWVSSISSSRIYEHLLITSRLRNISIFWMCCKRPKKHVLTSLVNVRHIILKLEKNYYIRSHISTSLRTITSINPRYHDCSNLRHNLHMLHMLHNLKQLANRPSS